MKNIAEPSQRIQEPNRYHGEKRPGQFVAPSQLRTGSDSAGASSLDTLAQLGQAPSISSKSAIPTPSPEVVELAQKQARAKYLTVPLATSLAELRSPLEQSYRNSIYCASQRMQTDDGRLVAKRCKCRWCVACNRIRTAEAINTYLPVVEEWSDPHFVTLTRRTVDGHSILPALSGSTTRSSIDDMITRAANSAKGVRRTDGIDFQGIRKLECTYNPRTGLYHPHFHFITNSRESAEALIARWLRSHDDPEWASPDAQDIRPADSRSLVELFKYSTKVVASQGGSVKRVSPERLDVIFRAFRDRRSWQPIGFKVPKPDGSEELELTATQAFKRVGEDVLWEWEQSVSDWIDKETGEGLTGYSPSDRVEGVVRALSADE